MKIVISIDVLNGLIYINGVMKKSESYFLICPFKTYQEEHEASDKCTARCPHCGDVEEDANGKKRVVLTCGRGTEIREKGFVPPCFEGSADE